MAAVIGIRARLVLDNLQGEQSKKELKAAEDVLPRVARECFKWLLCLSHENPTGSPSVENFALNTGGASLGVEIERVCLDNEWVIATWSPIHLRTKLTDLYWKADNPAVKAADFWEDTLRYLYLPRLKDRGVIAQAIVKGAGTRDFFGTAYGEHDRKFDGFQLGDANVQFDDTLRQCLRRDESGGSCSGHSRPINRQHKPKSFHGSAAVAPAAAKMRLVKIAEEVIAVLAADPNADVKVRIEIEATFPNGAQDQTKRAVSENAKTLGFGTAEWDREICISQILASNLVASDRSRRCQVKVMAVAIRALRPELSHGSVSVMSVVPLCHLFRSLYLVDMIVII